MRSAGGTKTAPPCVVTLATKSVIDFLTGPSFHDGSGSLCANARPPATAQSTVASSATKARREIVSMLSGSRHSVLYGANDRRDDRAGHAAADRLSRQRGDIDIAPRRTLQHRQERRQKRAAARAPERAGNGVAERAEVEVLHGGARGVPSDRAGDELDDEIDQGR